MPGQGIVEESRAVFVFALAQTSLGPFPSGAFFSAHALPILGGPAIAVCQD